METATLELQREPEGACWDEESGEPEIEVAGAVVESSWGGAGGRISGEAPSDVELMVRIGHGDAAALGVIFDRYWVPLVVFATGKLDSEEAAEDLVQEVFVRVWQGRIKLRKCVSPRAYLYSVLRNLITDEFRKRSVRRRGMQILQLETPSAAPSACAAVDGEELARAATQVIENLPDRRRNVFCLVRSGLSYREVAETLRITQRTVANHMYLALKDIREALTGHLEPEYRTGSGCA